MTSCRNAIWYKKGINENGGLRCADVFGRFRLYLGHIQQCIFDDVIETVTLKKLILIHAFFLHILQ